MRMSCMSWNAALKAAAGGCALLVNRALLLGSTKSTYQPVALTRPVGLICDLRHLLCLLALTCNIVCLAARSLEHSMITMWIR